MVRALCSMIAAVQVIICAASCSKREQGAERFEAAVGVAAPATVRVIRWKISRGVGERHAFYELEGSRSDVLKAFSDGGFVRSSDEEDSKFLEIVGRQMSDRFSEQVTIPNPATHYERRGAGKIVQVFVGSDSNQTIVWVRPGPSR